MSDGKGKKKTSKKTGERKKLNQWQRFRKRYAGQGLKVSEIAKLYRQQYGAKTVSTSSGKRKTKGKGRARRVSASKRSMIVVSGPGVRSGKMTTHKYAGHIKLVANRRKFKNPIGGSGIIPTKGWFTVEKGMGLRYAGGVVGGSSLAALAGYGVQRWGDSLGKAKPFVRAGVQAAVTVGLGIAGAKSKNAKTAAFLRGATVGAAGVTLLSTAVALYGLLSKKKSAHPMAMIRAKRAARAFAIPGRRRYLIKSPYLRGDDDDTMDVVPVSGAFDRVKSIALSSVGLGEEVYLGDDEYPAYDVGDEDDLSDDEDSIEGDEDYTQ